MTDQTAQQAEAREAGIIAGGVWLEPNEERECWTAEVQTVGGYSVVATVHGSTRMEAVARQSAILDALAFASEHPQQSNGGEVREAAQMVLNNASRPGRRMCFGGGVDGEDVWIDHKEVDQSELDRLSSALATNQTAGADAGEACRLLKNLTDVYDGMQNGDGEPCPDVEAAKRFFAASPSQPQADRVAELEERIILLEETLEPFAMACDRIYPDDPENDKPALVKAKDYRAARAALADRVGEGK